MSARKNRNRLQNEFDELEIKCQNLSPYSNFEYFNELPLSSLTQEGLQESNYIQMTEIQRKAIPLALHGKDVLGAAKTGSGKTLALLIPLIEKLFREKWSQLDGLGALVIAPTRELAVQIFEVLRKIGRKHTLSAGLVIGGKKLEVEQERINRMNILICTPGRLLQHMDQTASFNCDNLQILILDEADRILDMGFEKTVNAIIDNLPKERQTLLFSATQTNSVKDLARLSLTDPEYVFVHEQSEHSTPPNLSQYYLLCKLPEKLDILFSFIKSHLKTKGLVFFSSCKQVRFVYETFCKMQPGVTLMHLHGKQKQHKRLEIFNKFSSIKYAYLFATDIASRGLDFPAVDWVIQVDAPENADTYIHRVGRTARYEAPGNALLYLLPNEEQGMLGVLEKKKVPIEKIKVKPSKITSVQKQLQLLCFKDPEIKYLSQKAFISYMRSVYLQSDKSIFNVNELPAEEFSSSLGLSGTPKIKFAKKSGSKNDIREKSKERNERSEIGISDDDINSVDNQIKVDEKKSKPKKTKLEKMFQRKNMSVFTDHYKKLVEYESDKEDEFITLKRVNHELPEEFEQKKPESLSKRKLLMAKSKKHSIANAPRGEKLLFDEDGNAHQIYELQDENKFHAAGPVLDQKKKFLDKELKVMEEEDVKDKIIAKEKRREKKLKKKTKLKAQLEQLEELEDSEEEIAFKNKRHKILEDSEEETTFKNKRHKILEVEEPMTLEDQEELALKLLEGR